jgi:predicted nuclease with RNAse H fold
MTPRWAGVDVGGRRKGFDVAVVDDRGIVAGPSRLADTARAVTFLEKWSPRVIAVDSPRCPAPPGARSRPGERLLVQAICGLRYTPSQAVLDEGDPYYEWIVHGLELYRALAGGRWKVIECFPTASWTRIAGPRGVRSRAEWTREALAGLALIGVTRRVSQDARDAIVAAVTARFFDQDATEAFGEIVVPAGRVSSATVST